MTGDDGQVGPIPPSWVPFPSIGPDKLYVTPSEDERALPSRFIQPLVCLKRGSLRTGLGYVGVDSRILMGERYPAWGPAERRPCPMTADLPELGVLRPLLSMEAVLEAIGLSPEHQEILARGRPSTRRPRVAVIDADCGGWGALGDAVDETSPYVTPVNRWLQFPRAHRRPPPEQTVPGHGASMAGVVKAIAPRAQLGMFEAPLTQSSYVYPTDLAAAIARAVEEWRADVVLVAMAHGYWGMPAHLRTILKAAAGSGRGGRGTAIVCCSGRLDQNRDLHGDSAALAGDDLASQPWVIAVAASTLDGRWYRVNQYPLSRLGPSIELCAPGEPVTVPGAGTADDSSLAAAVVAGAAALVLETNPELTLAELRQLLRMTADVSVVDDAPAGTGIEAGRLNERDRTGHNFKVGYGKVHAMRACLAAADPVSFALLTSQPDELKRARAWEESLHRMAASSSRAREYLEVRKCLVPQVLVSPDLRDALHWLARHLHQIRRDGSPSWWDDGMDHGVLIDRIQHAVELSIRLPGTRPSPEDGRVERWAEHLLDALNTVPVRTITSVLAALLDFQHCLGHDSGAGDERSGHPSCPSTHGGDEPGGGRRAHPDRRGRGQRVFHSG